MQQLKNTTKISVKECINKYIFLFNDKIKDKKNKNSWKDYIIPMKAKRKLNISGNIDKILYNI
ncbi:hypothetical protein KKC83_01485 [Patescibacteria group bacterium]|nr:hypothetical protein [Candidatus Falkowbacteria bacterium]MBU3906053.1 hypothetical protein [Patescibacteria group bacterium]MCG2698382.1 hypothetical protein [Candidatus Parcubacteria bacterium]MBU4015082.1 hypothetical protein [Patescibacteria group bacterium]MBU4026198.1 hypothetical protein [Patescibacteria group bacterium]